MLTLILQESYIIVKLFLRKKLNLHGNKNVCLFSFNGKPGEFKDIKKRYSYLEDAGYTMVYTTNYDGGLFPAVDYSFDENGADQLVDIMLGIK